MNRIPILLAVALFALACGHTNPHRATLGSGSESVADASPLEAGRRWARAFHERDFAAWWGQFDERLRRHVGNEAALAQLAQAVEAQLGRETRVIEEKAEHRAYLRRSLFDRSGSEAAELQIHFDSSGR